ncbi:MAG: SdpI family protein [Candidatus Lokiarchaeota archaeon]|nr:SdpI family protein [Candidatus Lokiarchaeota archaeon]
MIGFITSLIYTIFFFFSGMLLIFRKVKPNHIYGFRVSKFVFKSDDIWYEVNTKGGIHSIIIGFVLLVITLLALVYINDSMMQVIFLFITLFITILGPIFSLIITYNLAHRLAKEKGLK